MYSKTMLQKFTDRITAKTETEKMVLFHIAAVGWISPQTGYKIQGSISTQI